VIYPGSEFVGAGGLIRYGSNLTEVRQVAVHYLSLILNGAKPADLPIESWLHCRIKTSFRSALRGRRRSILLRWRRALFARVWASPQRGDRDPGREACELLLPPPGPVDCRAE